MNYVTLSGAPVIFLSHLGPLKVPIMVAAKGRMPYGYGVFIRWQRRRS